jgi:hypothetical protein
MSTLLWSIATLLMYAAYAWMSVGMEDWRMLAALFIAGGYWWAMSRAINAWHERERKWRWRSPIERLPEGRKP